MEIVKCSKGHFYDAELFQSCPQCDAESCPDGSGSGYVGATEPAGFEPIGATEPVGRGEDMAIPPGSFGRGIPPTVPVARQDFTVTDFVLDGMGRPSSNAKMQGYEPTMPVPSGGIAGFNPVTGWLVCVDGPEKGRDYRIRNGYNYIGKAQNMDICIQGDNHISSQNAAVIGYDDVEKLFSFGPAGGRNTVRVNGKMVINAVQLNAYDELTVGTTKLMFVPLCGERFDWNAENG